MDIFEGPKRIVYHPGCRLFRGKQYIGAEIICLVVSLYYQEVHQYDIKSQVYILETDAQVLYQNSKDLQAFHAVRLS